MVTARRVDPWLILAALVATLNLALGVWVSWQHPSDLYQVAGWAEQWRAGQDPYNGPNYWIDYPPNALMMLAPLALASGPTLLTLWIAVNLGLAAWTIALLVPVSEANRRSTQLLAALLASCVCWHTLSQFSVLSFAFALAGARSSSTAAGGIWLGLSLMKPQIGGPILLWTWLRGRRSRVVVALCVAVALALLWAARLGVGPYDLAVEYFFSLERAQGDLRVLPSTTDLRAWIAPFWPPDVSGLLAMLGLALLLLVPLAVRARRPDGVRAVDDFEGMAFCGVVSLLAIRHLAMDFLLLLPLVVAWRVPPFTLRPAPRWQQIGFWTVAGLLVVAIPPLWRQVLVPLGAPPALGAVVELDRVLCLGVWGVLSWRLLRAHRVYESPA